MKTLGFMFSYNRAATLRDSIKSVYEASKFVPENLTLIDDGSTDPEIATVLADAREKYGLPMVIKPTNTGFSDSAARAIKAAREQNPDYFFFIEGDYVFRKHGMDTVMEVLTNTPEGEACMGIVGYDQPNFRNPHYTKQIFPDCMRAQIGEDNVNRDAMYRPEMKAGAFHYSLELATNTCWSAYLNWRNIQKVAAEFPELNDYLDQAVWPRENPNYPDSGKYKALRVVDDGMLSHCLSLFWNRYAIKHGIDRNKFGAWLNIRPSVAEHRFQGGMHFP